MLAVAAALAALPGQAAVAQDGYPNRPVQIVLPYPPGNAIDLLVRSLAQAMSPLLGQPVVVINRNGAAGVVGSVFVSRQPADGYTLLFMPALVASVLPITQPSSGLRADTFLPICQVFNNAMALIVRPDSPIRHLRDLQARARAAPGRRPSARSASPRSGIWPWCSGCWAPASNSNMCRSGPMRW